MPFQIIRNDITKVNLCACYANSLSPAAKLRCESIAFSLLATGSYGYPKDEALHIALSEIGRFLLTHEMTVILVVFDSASLRLSEKTVGGIEKYIDERTVRIQHKTEYGSRYGIRDRRRRLKETENYAEPTITASLSIGNITEQEDSDLCCAPQASLMPDVSGKSLDEVLGTGSETFQQKLFSLIDLSGMDDVTVYKKANIDRKVFSRIRCKADYKPKKKTAVLPKPSTGFRHP